MGKVRDKDNNNNFRSERFSNVEYRNAKRNTTPAAIEKEKITARSNQPIGVIFFISSIYHITLPYFNLIITKQEGEGFILDLFAHLNGYSGLYWRVIGLITREVIK